MADSELTQAHALLGKKKRGEESHVRGLYALNLFGALSAAEFALVIGMSVPACRARLNNLVSDGLAGIVRRKRAGGRGGRPMVRYFLKPAGHDLALESKLVDAGLLGAYRSAQYEAKFTKSPDHKTGVMRTMIAAFLATERVEGIVLETMYSSFRADPKALAEREQSKDHEKGGGVVRETTMVGMEQGFEIRCSSDGAFVLLNEHTGRRALFNIEYDRGFERIPSRDGLQGLTSDSIEGKCRLFVRFMADGTMTDVFVATDSSHILFVAPTERRVQSMIDRVRWEILPRIAGQDARQFFRFTTEAQAERNFLGAIWRQPGRSDLLPLAQGAV